MKPITGEVRAQERVISFFRTELGFLASAQDSNQASGKIAL